MNLLRTSLMAVVLLFVATSCSKDEIPVEPETNFSVDLSLANKTDWTMANDILVLVNDHRRSLNLEPIKLDRQLATAYAVMHTEYMIDNERISHDGYAQRSLALQNDGAQSVGENVARGYRSAEDVVNAWLNSQSHRRVIEGDYTHCGFGVMQDYRGTFYFTQLFYSE
ncbi:CAP domain-containing protein [Gilvibacter sediminis]|uniref:CAP domain-containing protein n=1 Tax=Gilvibacter sediminis TaxID=379071 RepID=UPI002350EAF5|nr:CAP domain-containing protein [Gilvibacter sediminis]MDC7996975.1 CAP domain-containing protein [Gilvibacter sediminis]